MYKLRIYILEFVYTNIGLVENDKETILDKVYSATATLSLNKQNRSEQKIKTKCILHIIIFIFTYRKPAVYADLQYMFFRTLSPLAVARLNTVLVIHSLLLCTSIFEY